MTHSPLIPGFKMDKRQQWIDDVFIPKHKNKLNELADRNRGDGFQAIFENIKLSRKRLVIVETGTMRPGFTEEGDGQSTQLFNSFAKHLNGRVYSVDIDPKTKEFAQTKVDENITKLFTMDSVKFLWHFDSYAYLDLPDLFYLDSYDVDFSNPMASNLHHIKELAAISRYLSKDVLVAVDDCHFADNDWRVPNGVRASDVGKGNFVSSFMKDINASLIFDGYQKVWRI